MSRVLARAVLCATLVAALLCVVALRTAIAGGGAGAGAQRRRVALIVSGSSGKVFQSSAHDALASHDFEVLDSRVAGRLQELEGAETSDYADFSRELELTAVVEGTVVHRDASWELTLVVRNGKDGDVLGLRTIRATGSGTTPLEEQIQARLWPTLQDLLGKAESPARRSAAPERAEPEAAPQPDAPRPVADRKPAPDAPHRTRPVALVSGSFVQDLAFVPGGRDVCTPASQADGTYSCFRQSGTQYLGTPVKGEVDGVGTGVAVATSRLVLGADLLVGERLTLGARVGAAFRGGGPTPSSGERFMPLHLEARAGYWFRGPAFSGRFSPYLFVATGLSQVDASVAVKVHEDGTASPPPSQLDNPHEQELAVWRKAGAGFAAAGIGGLLGVGSGHGVLVDLRGSGFFPSPGAAVALNLGYAIGL